MNAIWMLFACYAVAGGLGASLLAYLAFGVSDELAKLKREYALHRKIRRGTATREEMAFREPGE